jgi:hypothetical protein
MSITLYTDAFNDVLAFTDSTGTYPLSNNPFIINNYIIPINPEISRWTNDYKYMYSEFFGLPESASINYSEVDPVLLNESFTQDDLSYYGMLTAYTLRKYI